MNKQRILLFSVAGCVLVGAIYFTTKSSPGKASAGEIVWTDYGAGSTASQASNKTMLIDVYTDWCTWCKTMDKKTYADPAVMQYVHEHFVPVKLNAESQTVRTVRGAQMSDADLAQAFGVSGYPTTVFVGADGKPITSVDGYVEASEFHTILRFIAEEKYKSMSYKDFKSGQK